MKDYFKHEIRDAPDDYRRKRETNVKFPDLAAHFDARSAYTAAVGVVALKTITQNLWKIKGSTHHEQ